jgi:hypothetical protein
MKDEGLADPGLPDEQQRSFLPEPVQRVDLFDLGFADRS